MNNIPDATYAVKQATVGVGKWFITETVNGVERVVGSLYGYATYGEARFIADRMSS